MQVFRLHALPATIVPNALYFIGADGQGLCRAYVSGHTGNINEIEGVTNEADVIALAAATIAATPFAGLDLGTFN